MELGVSVIICCYNSARRLPETLQHLSMQQVPAHIKWEIIVIDNASTDNTATIAAEIWNGFNAPIDFYIEKQPIAGLINARKKGIEKSRYDYLLFCDDDNWLNENYIKTAHEILDADALIGALGGAGTVVAEQPAKLSQHELNQLTVNGPQTWAETDHWVYGAGSLYRKSILIDLLNKGWQQITTGRNGTQLISCEDVEICFMIYLSGYKIIADNRLTFKHLVALQKQNDTFRLKMAWGLSYSYFLMTGYLSIINKEKRSLKNIINRELARHIKTLARYHYQKLKNREITLENKIALQSIYGTISSIIRNRKKVMAHYQHLIGILNKNPSL